MNFDDQPIAVFSKSGAKAFARIHNFYMPRPSGFLSAKSMERGREALMAVDCRTMLDEIRARAACLPFGADSGEYHRGMKLLKAHISAAIAASEAMLFDGLAERPEARRSRRI